MPARSPEPKEVKLSAELRRRLARMAPGHAVRAVVLMDTGAPVRVGRAGGRKKAVGAVRTAAKTAKLDLDTILFTLGGHWLSDEPDALGSMEVEAPVAAILALAESDRVRAILEDQRVSPLPRPKR